MTAPTPPNAVAKVGSNCDTATPDVDPTLGPVARPAERLFVPIEGDLDLYTTPDLAQRLCPLAARGWHLRLDLSGLEFLGVAGLMLLVNLYDAAGASGGSLQLESVPASTLRLLRLVGLDALLPDPDEQPRLEALRLLPLLIEVTPGVRDL